MEQVKLSILIATFNSERFLPAVIGALREQDLAPESYEILLVDGGSSDGTLALAEKFQCRVINNPRTEPVYAKYLGIRNAKGGYVLFLDHDEVLTARNSLSKRISIMERDDLSFILTSGYRNPEGFPFINQYINEFGEPFSFFYYRLSKDWRFFTSTMRRRYSVCNEDEQHVVFQYERSALLPLIELCAVGTMLNRSFLMRELPELLENYIEIPHFFYHIVDLDSRIAISKDDVIDHYSAEEVVKYLKKIDWRIRNNVYFSDEIGASGFSGRAAFEEGFLQRMKKALFIPYAYTLLLPIVDAASLAVSRRDLRYFWHPFLCLWTACSITYHMMVRSLGLRPSLKSYDGAVKIKESGESVD